MKLSIKTTNIKLSDALSIYIDEKINSLGKYIEKLYEDQEFFEEGKPLREAWVEVGKISRHHNKGDVFRAEVQIRFPGKSIRAEAEREDLRLAIDEVKDELQREFKEYFDKQMAKYERGVRAIKRKVELPPEVRAEEGKRVREEGL